MLVGVWARAEAEAGLAARLPAAARRGQESGLAGLRVGGDQEWRPEEARRQPLALQSMKQKRQDLNSSEMQIRLPLLDQDIDLLALDGFGLL